MSTKLISAKQLNSLADTVKGKINVLDTVPATVNGGLWLDGGGSSPVIKLFYNGAVFKTELSPMPDPQLTFNRKPNATELAQHIFYCGEETGTDFGAYDGTVAVTVSYIGEGNITVSSDSNSTVSYDSATRTITVNNVKSDSTVTVSLSSSGDYAAAQSSFIAHIASTLYNVVTPGVSNVIRMEAGGEPQSVTIGIDASNPYYKVQVANSHKETELEPWVTFNANGNIVTFAPDANVASQGYPFMVQVIGNKGVSYNPDAIFVYIKPPSTE